MSYPFKPKSTAYLERGQYWSIPLSNGKYCCGVVLHLLLHLGKKEQRSFHAGLLSWDGEGPPTKEDISGCSVLESGAAHIKTITEIGGEILGKSKLKSDDDLIEKTDDIHTWGYNFINLLGEKHFIKNS